MNTNNKFRLNLHLKERFQTVLFIAICVLVGVAIYFSSEITNRWNALVFTYEHPQLVSALSERYASGSAELEKNLLKQEKTAQDKLIEAVADDLSLK